MGNNILIITCVLTAAGAAALYLTFPLVLQYGLSFVLPLSQGSESAAVFQKTPVQAQWKFYFYNVTNPEVFAEVQNPSASTKNEKEGVGEEKPTEENGGGNETITTTPGPSLGTEPSPGGFRGTWYLNEIGPFVVNDDRRKELMRWRDDGTQLEFIPVNDLSFDCKQKIDLEINVTTINPIAMTFSKIFHGPSATRPGPSSSPARTSGTSGGSKKKGGKKRHPREAAAAPGKGKKKLKTPPPYEMQSPLLSVIPELMGYAMGGAGGGVGPQEVFAAHSAESSILTGYKVKELEQIEQTLRTKYGLKGIPNNPLPNNFFALLGVMIGTGERTRGPQKTLRIQTGSKEFSDLGLITAWNGQSKLSVWGKEENSCNNLTGSTNGEIFPPLSVDEESVLKVWIPTLCRVLSFSYDSGQGDEDLLDNGIKVKRFKLANNTWWAAFGGSRKETCYCVDPKDPLCKQEGLLDLGPCMSGSPPIYMSQIGLKDVSPQIAKRFKGMPKYSAAQHETFLMVEPISGIVTSGAIRIQLNVHIPKYAKLNLSDSEPIVFPYVRIDIENQLDEVVALKLRAGLWLLDAVKLSIIGLGISAAALLIILLCCQCCGSRKKESPYRDDWRECVEDYDEDLRAATASAAVVGAAAAVHMNNNYHQNGYELKHFTVN